MVEGETYVVLTPDGENLNGGLCSPCPYILFDDYVPAPPAYDPADDPTCKTYNDGCNTCSKGEN